MCTHVDARAHVDAHAQPAPVRLLACKSPIGSTEEPSTTCTSNRHRSMCRRKAIPIPTPSCAPSSSPGMSASTWGEEASHRRQRVTTAAKEGSRERERGVHVVAAADGSTAGGRELRARATGRVCLRAAPSPNGVGGPRAAPQPKRARAAGLC
eukprot:6653912-Prymnesium_polylepis.1